MGVKLACFCVEFVEEPHALEVVFVGGFERFTCDSSVLALGLEGEGIGHAEDDGV